MKLLLLIVCIFHIFSCVLSSPFKITDKYIQDYREGIDRLTKEAEHYHHQEGNITDYKDADTKTDEYEYDFIIVGGGTSGAVLANRLSEVPEYKVLLLEAGGEETKITKIPALFNILEHSEHTWGYLAEPEETWCLESKCHVRAAKILGGTSSINNLIYSRGNARDYDLWADQGNKGWCYADVEPYFKKSENMHLDHFDRKYHNQGGPMDTEFPRYLTNLSDHFLHAGKELEYKVVDYNGKKQIGFAVPQLNTCVGVRESTSAAYLETAVDRPNLIVRPFSHVIEIIISPHTKDIKGVKYIHGKEIFIVKSSKEVILTTGAINTPHLLMVSGVGHKEQLEKAEIECVAESKHVGHNLKDHLRFIGLNYFLNDSLLHLDHCDPEHILTTWLKAGKGPLSTTGVEGLAYLKTEASKEAADFPDIEISFVPRPKTEIHETGFDLIIILLHPKSEGFIALKSKDPLNWPKIHLGHLSDEDDHDIHTLLAGIRLAQKLAETESFKKIGASLNTQVTKGCEKYEFNSDDYWKCAIRHQSISAGHYTGTARMGADADAGVVDTHLRVHGVHKLRVADVSIIPVSISGHTQAAAVMIAEKAADLIKHDWK